MERLEDYIAFDLEFNQHEGQTHLIQVSAVRLEMVGKSMPMIPMFIPASL